MKKLISLFLVILLFSCSSSSDDDKSENTSTNSSFNPPAWIQGSWDEGIVGYKFSSDNVCQVLSTTQICFKEMINNYNKAMPNSSTVNEPIKTDTEYKFSYTVQSVSQEFHFRKISSTKIELVNPIKGQPNSVLIKQ